MTLGDVVIQNLGNETTHTKDEIVSILRQQSRLVRVPVLGEMVATLYMLIGLELKEQAGPTESADSHPYMGELGMRELELVCFARQPDGRYMVYRTTKLVPNT